MKGKTWRREGMSKGGILVSESVNSYGDGPARYVGVLLDFSLKDQARALAAPALAEALERAEQFIINGVELGYIRMPTEDSKDSALDTLPAIQAALSLARGERQ